MHIALQNIASGIHIAIHLGPTLRARVPPDREIFRHERSTVATSLGRVAWVDFRDDAASFFRFACTQSQQGAPGRIQNTLIQATFGGCPVGEKCSRLCVLPGFLSPPKLH